MNVPIYQISYLLQIIRKCDKYFKNLSYLSEVAIGGIHCEKELLLASCFLPFIYRHDALLHKDKV